MKALVHEWCFCNPQSEPTVVLTVSSMYMLFGNSTAVQPLPNSNPTTVLLHWSFNGLALHKAYSLFGGDFRRRKHFSRPSTGEPQGEVTMALFRLISFDMLCCAALLIQTKEGDEVRLYYWTRSRSFSKALHVTFKCFGEQHWKYLKGLCNHTTGVGEVRQLD